MRCKALVPAEESREKTYSTTSIAMDWLHSQQRLHKLQRQLLFKHPHQLLLLRQLQLQHRYLCRPQHLHHVLQLHRVIANKLYRYQKFVDSLERTW